MNWNAIIIQGIGFIGCAFYLASYQVKSNRLLLIVQALGCFSFIVQFALLGAYSGCLSLIITMVRNLMLTKYNEYKWIQWKGWIAVFSVLVTAAVLFTWNDWKSILLIIGTIAATAAYWTNNARNIRLANLCVNCPAMVLYDLLVGSWGGVLEESISIISIVVSIVRFGWAALDGDTIKDKD